MKCKRVWIMLKKILCGEWKIKRKKNLKLLKTDEWNEKVLVRASMRSQEEEEDWNQKEAEESGEEKDNFHEEEYDT